MDSKPQKRRTTFGLLSLLLIVAICGVGLGLYRLLPNRIDFSKMDRLLGASTQEVEELFGSPDEVFENDGVTNWVYRGQDSAHLRVEFSSLGCIGYEWSHLVNGVEAGGGGQRVF